MQDVSPPGFTEPLPDPASENEHPSEGRSYHHGNLKVSLIDAGVAALDHTEVDALSLRQLAKVVGVSANAAYRHFADKDALLTAMAAEGFRRFAAAQSASVVGLAQAEDRLKASGRAYVAFAQTHPALYRLMFQRMDQVMADPALMAHCSGGGMAVLLEATSSLVGAPLDDERVRVAAAACWSLVHGLSSLAQGGQLGVFGLPMPDLIDRVLALPTAFAAHGA
jgi:AcrR family transcriptional regulator